ncbi:pyruvate, phosphate dikinase [Candidatus Woesearchaeota archaeon]|nr:pyruvate, phosphate dikinase [Candidatus Woesearchaeota archaeon]
MAGLLGGKGANLAEMASIDLNIPQGFTITTETCRIYNTTMRLPDGLFEELRTHLDILETKTGKTFGDDENPLLVSVRSGAKVSMPGMMDTILNIGLNSKTVEVLAKIDERFAWDSFRRFIQMFGDVVLGIKMELFENELSKIKKTAGVSSDQELSAFHLKHLVTEYLKIVYSSYGEFPSDPHTQLIMAVEAVFKSWDNDRAKTYRRINNIPHDICTAATVQSMVFGNMDTNSGTGVCFTRNPSGGTNQLTGEYLINAQGEDVVAGIRTPQPISELQTRMPHVFKELKEVCEKLENHYKDMQDIEFTVEKGKLYLLQTRTGKRTAQAAIKIATDLVQQGIINKKTAVMRISPVHINQILHKQIDPCSKNKENLFTKALPASPGAAVGRIALDSDTVIKMADRHEDAVLVRKETSPDDIEGMHLAQGILTARGGITSHAAVVARGMGKCCITGASDIIIDYEARTVKTNGKILKEGDMLTLDGTTGEAYFGKLDVTEPAFSKDLQLLLSWADGFKSLFVRTNADTPEDAKKAREFGAQGIGLCRTEHMFFKEDRINAMREMILAYDEEGRKKALLKLLPYQKKDFLGIFESMEGLPVTIRLLDPPLHEFLPTDHKDLEIIANRMGVSKEDLQNKINSLREFNPMLGHRGCRLAITYPEIAEMQVHAIISAASELQKQGKEIIPEIEVPLIGSKQELEFVSEIINRTANRIMKRHNTNIKYKIGTMIEVPRAALTAGSIAESADFFSFGTNDLTQMGFGFSRDDSDKFISQYMKKGIFIYDPFQQLDQEGIGELVKITVEKGRQTKPSLEIGICGEHGGEPESIKFFHKAGLDYVSCSPYRVPAARLVAAQASIVDDKAKTDI